MKTNKPERNPRIKKLRDQLRQGLLADKKIQSSPAIKEMQAKKCRS